MIAQVWARKEFCDHLLAPLPSCPTAQPCFNVMLLAQDVKLFPRKEIPLPTLGYEAGFHTQQYSFMFPLPDGYLIACNSVRHTKTAPLVYGNRRFLRTFYLENLTMKFRWGGVTQCPFSSFSLFSFLHVFHPDPTFYRVFSPGYIAKDDFKRLLLLPPPPGC